MKIIQDTKEKNPFDFSFFNLEVKVQHLKTGDYTIEGLEDVLCIERKATTGEIAINLGQKSKAFYKEFQRMGDFRFKYIICEFNIDRLNIFPKHSGIPEYKQKYIRVTPQFLRSRFHQWADEFGIEIIYTNSKEDATKEAMRILKETYEFIQSEK